MEKRFQIFISSTYVDLKEERNEVIKAILELDCFPTGMELFPAADDSQWEVIKSIIDNCDYYILILGGRYGSTKDGLSYTEMEYDYAIKKGIPTITFLHENIESISVSKSEKTEIGKKKLAEFRNKLENKLCKFWNTPQELGSVVSRSLVQLIKQKPAVGWVRADKIMSNDSATEILRLKKELEELNNQNDFEPKGVDHLKQGFDIFEINYSFKMKDESDGDNGLFDYDIFTKAQHYKGTTTTINWNEIFYVVSPLMINESNENKLIEAINQLIEQKEKFEIAKGFSNSKIFGFVINDEDFHTILIQLRSLKLIQKSEKKRRVDDTNNYWKLSKYGDNLMTNMRALKKVIE